MAEGGKEIGKQIEPVTTVEDLNQADGRNETRLIEFKDGHEHEKQNAIGGEQNDLKSNDNSDKETSLIVKTDGEHATKAEKGVISKTNAAHVVSVEQHASLPTTGSQDDSTIKHMPLASTPSAPEAPNTGASQTLLPSVSEAPTQGDKDVSDNKPSKIPTEDLSGDTQQPITEEEHNLYRKTRSILNKLAPQKFQTLVLQMKALPIDTETKLKGVVDLVFEKAISEPIYSVAYGEPNYSVAYANMCRCLSMREFEKDRSSEAVFKQKRQEIETAEESKKEELEAQLEKEECKAKRRSLGNIRFLGELFKLKMLTENIMHDCVYKLLRTKDPDNLECLCCFLTIIGKELDVEKAKPRMDQYFQQMQKIVNDKKMSPKIRFMLQDVIDLRLNKWVPRRTNTCNPKTIDQIHKEVEMEAQERTLLQMQGRCRLGLGGARRGTSGLTGDCWNTLGGTRPKTVDRSIDPTKIRFSKPNVEESQIEPGPGGGASRFAGWGRGLTGQTKTTMSKRRIADLIVTPQQRMLIFSAAKLHFLIDMQHTNNEKVIHWIESNVDESTKKQPKFIRALMTAVCKSAIKGEKGKEPVEPKQIRERTDLLQKYLDFEPELELQALYALQALVTKLKHPPGLLRHMFDTLYDEDLISKEAFILWERSQDEPDGKPEAFQQVIQFFKCLRDCRSTVNLHTLTEPYAKSSV